MATKKFKSLNDTFEIESETVSCEIEKAEIEPIVKKSSDITKDYEYSRATLTSLVEKGQEAIDSILELAQETDSPRGDIKVSRGIFDTKPQLHVLGSNVLNITTIDNNLLPSNAPFGFLSIFE
jgi:hypothetical protein